MRHFMQEDGDGGHDADVPSGQEWSPDGKAVCEVMRAVCYQVEVGSNFNRSVPFDKIEDKWRKNKNINSNAQLLYNFFSIFP